jgi:Leucine-rich repeat (LRR) protein
VKLRQARKQREAVEAILRTGGRVRYDYQMTGTEPQAPEWLWELLGDDFFFDVSSVNLQLLVDDDVIKHLTDLPNLREVYLSSSKVTDAGLEEYIEGRTNLELLSLWDTHVTDAGLQHLKGLINLERLYLEGTQVTDAGLEHIKGLTNLKHLYLEGTNVTDAGVEGLKETLPQVEIDY